MGAAIGLRGEVRVDVFTADPDAIGTYGPLTTVGGRPPLTVKSIRALAGSKRALRFAGIDDRTAAESLHGLELFIPRDRLPEVEGEEFYHADLVGMRAVTSDGADLGSVQAVHNFGAGDLLEIGTKTHKFYLPFTRQAVPEVRLAERRLIVTPPADTEGEPE